MDRADRFALLQRAPLDTPAFVIDTEALRADAQTARACVQGPDNRLLFAMKSFTVVEGLAVIAEHVDGFAASSLYEAQLARTLMHEGQTLHITSPGLRPADRDAICETVDYITFNSLGQWEAWRSAAIGRVECGLRVNPQLSFVEDARYDPCQAHSKLGVPLDVLVRVLREAPEQLEGIRGIHFHTNCDSEDLLPLKQTIEYLLEHLDPLFDQLVWINVGGGYLFESPDNAGALAEAREMLRKRGDYRVFFEPGASISRSAGQFVATVVDLFDSSGRAIAVLDTTATSHMPEAFEYAFEPDVVGDGEDFEHEVVLAGATCLAGDVFGLYAFEKPLAVGDRVIFPDMGAYSMVKASWFNGIGLPTIYALDPDGSLRQVKRFELDDFKHACGG